MSLLLDFRSSESQYHALIKKKRNLDGFSVKYVFINNLMNYLIVNIFNLLLELKFFRITASPLGRNTTV